MPAIHDPADSPFATWRYQEDRGPALRAYIITMLVISVIAVGGRFIARAKSGQNNRIASRFWWDDWLILACLIMLLVGLACLMEMIHLGLGRHTWFLQLTNLKLYLRLIFIIYIFYILGVALGKASVLAFYYRMLCKGQNRPWLWRWLYFAQGLNIAWLIGTFIANFLQCDPVEKNFNIFLPGKCIHTSLLWLSIGVPSVIIDFIILLLPLPIIWKLTLNKTKKIGLTIIFLLGYSVIVVTLTRVILSFTLRARIDRDLSYEGITVMYWMIAEVPLTIVSSCLPTMVNFARYIAGRFNHLGSRISSKFGSYGSHGSSSDSKSMVYARSRDQHEKNSGLDSGSGSVVSEVPSQNKGMHGYSVSVSRDERESELRSSEELTYGEILRSHGRAHVMNVNVNPQSIYVQNEFSVSRSGGNEARMI